MINQENELCVQEVMPADKFSANTQTDIISDVIQFRQRPREQNEISPRHDINSRYYKLMLCQAQLAVPAERLRQLEQEVAVCRQREATLHVRVKDALENIGGQLSLHYQLQKVTNAFHLYRSQQFAQRVTLLDTVRFQRSKIRRLHIEAGMKTWDATHQGLIVAGDDKKREQFYR